MCVGGGVGVWMVVAVGGGGKAAVSIVGVCQRDSITESLYCSLSTAHTVLLTLHPHTHNTHRDRVKSSYKRYQPGIAYHSSNLTALQVGGGTGVARKGVLLFGWGGSNRRSKLWGFGESAKVRARAQMR